ncbi:MAG: hypothetical protein KatS3mg082_2851 [Nitrospiraceae bacterium]|nr:MAG: hypothetical protein KatS3mg082_2851 [Nitrospiraceae bacterium]
MGPEHKGSQGTAGPEVHRQQVLEALDRIVSSTVFRGSRRCKELLRYLVEKRLDGELEALKERVIGAELFGRAIDYDTSNDAIVRVQVNELRKRLAAYYGEAGINEVLRIELPPGSYVPIFHNWRETGDDGNSTHPLASKEVSGRQNGQPHGRRRQARHWWFSGAGTVLAVLILATVWLEKPQASAWDRLWTPVFHAQDPILICIPARERWFFDPDVRRTLREAAFAQAPRLVLELRTGSITVVDHAEMSVHNFRAVLTLSTFLARQRVPAAIRLVSEVSADETRRRHVILLGAYHNPWAMEMSSGLRYVFESAGEGSQESTWIADRKAGGTPQWKVPRLWPYARQTTDYAIVSRTYVPESGQVVITLAGLNGFGTQVAAEFLTNSSYWKGDCPERR